MSSQEFFCFQKIVLVKNNSEYTVSFIQMQTDCSCIFYLQKPQNPGKINQSFFLSSGIVPAQYSAIYMFLFVYLAIYVNFLRSARSVFLCVSVYFCVPRAYIQLALHCVTVTVAWLAFVLTDQYLCSSWCVQCFEYYPCPELFIPTSLFPHGRLI